MQENCDLVLATCSIGRRLQLRCSYLAVLEENCNLAKLSSNSAKKDCNLAKLSCNSAKNTAT